MANYTSVAVERLQRVTLHGSEWYEFRRDYLISLRSHIADLEARAEKAKAREAELLAALEQLYMVALKAVVHDHKVMERARQALAAALAEAEGRP